MILSTIITYNSHYLYSLINTYVGGEYSSYNKIIWNILYVNISYGWLGAECDWRKSIKFDYPQPITV